ncbi:hypothetical protein CAPTEDRAFT_191930 [Capitella teleta]|uniref:Peptidase A1 domain-containing protein n=1 Tax=Capitella teleta TaxID=283909 RepID=R7VJN2_CAPTE|nr:hypothetical protein CAPTEDRAFT_191930 [Capitella teleta]|eukprot:ELU16626.1 hypothetical protein CAPTEDRAFT_191930 [Capitella teleta]
MRMSASRVVGLLIIVLLPKTSHECSMGFRSGKYGTQETTATSFSSKKPQVTAAACGQALSCWKKNDIWVCLHEEKDVRCQDFIDVTTNSDVPLHYDEICSVLHGDSRPNHDAWTTPAVVLLDTGSDIAFSLASPYSLTTIGYRTTKTRLVTEKNSSPYSNICCKVSLCVLPAQITPFFLFWYDRMVACRGRRAFIPAVSKRLRTMHADSGCSDLVAKSSSSAFLIRDDLLLTQFPCTDSKNG